MPKIILVAAGRSLKKEIVGEFDFDAVPEAGDRIELHAGSATIAEYRVRSRTFRSAFTRKTKKGKDHQVVLEVELIENEW